MVGFVSADGSPALVYLALPADDSPALIAANTPPGGTALELGSGPGRITRVLVALGLRVTAVDDSAEMLAHVTGARTVCADLFALDLDQGFDTVVAASHLINHPDPARRAALLAVCARHVRADHGAVLVQRHPPGWLRTAEPSRSRHGLVELSFEPLRRTGPVLSASMTYRLGEVEWIQRFDAFDLDDDQLADEADAAGLSVDRHLTDDGRWLLLRSR